MTTPLNDTQKTPKKVVMNIRHSPSVKNFSDEKAKEQNLLPSTMYRNIYSAGLEAMFKVKIYNNEIVPPPSC